MQNAKLSVNDGSPDKAMIEQFENAVSSLTDDATADERDELRSIF